MYDVARPQGQVSFVYVFMWELLDHYKITNKRKKKQLK